PLSLRPPLRQSTQSSGRAALPACQRREAMSLIRRASVTVIQNLALVLLSSSVVVAQSFTATVRGTVKDSSGSSVPLAAVTITDNDRGTSQATVADDAGRFVLSALPPGQYVVTVEANGF